MSQLQQHEAQCSFPVVFKGATDSPRGFCLKQVRLQKKVILTPHCVFSMTAWQGREPGLINDPVRNNFCCSGVLAASAAC